MELEQKVQALEQELQILKNQIQATLLDIQEQVLTNAHPSLRADDAMPSGSGGGGSRSDSRDEPASNVRKVSLDQVRIIEADDEPAESDEMNIVPARPKPDARKTARQPAAARPQTRQADWDTLAEMEQWVSRKVNEMGASRTRKLIAMYGQQGRFTEGEREALMAYVAIFDDDDDDLETELARPARKPGTSPQRQPAPQPNGRQTSPVRQTPALPQPAAARPQPSSGNGRSQTGTRAQPAARQQTSTHPQPAARPQEPARPATRQPETPGQDSNTSLVLKLIAGVQNAGAGVKWKKNNG